MASCDEHLTTLTLCMASYMLIKRRRQRRKANKNKRLWVRTWVQRRMEQGCYNNLLVELKTEDDRSFANFSRVFPNLFHELEEMVTPFIQRKTTNWRAAISPGERLSLTLRFLATGETYRSLSYQFRLGETTIGKIIPETCEAIYDVLKDTYFKCPNTSEEWQLVANGFRERWNMPNCIGALDGKHVTVRPPLRSGSQYFNYKHSFIVVMMALVDSDYKFLFVDVGANGRVSDGGVFAGCSLQESLQNRTANIPDPRSLPGDEREVAYFIVADEAFPLKEYILKPYPHRNLSSEQRVYNYRLSRARRVVENAFGILSNRFRVFLTPIALEPPKVENIVMASCALHNYLRVKAGTSYSGDHEDPVTHDHLPGAWRQDPILLQAAFPSGNNPTMRAKAMRDYVCDYVNSDVGSVPWQWDKC